MSPRVKNCLLVLTIAVVFTAIASMTGVGIRLDFGSDGLTVKGPEKFQYTVPYSRITALELVQGVDLGQPSSGGENQNYRWGQWENSLWQSYTMCTCRNADIYILLTLEDGSRFLFNYQDNSTTVSIQEMFAQLLAHYEAE